MQPLEGLSVLHPVRLADFVGPRSLTVRPLVEIAPDLARVGPTKPAATAADKISLVPSFVGVLFLRQRRRLRMRVPVTFRAEAEQQCHDHKTDDPFLLGSEDKFVTQLLPSPAFRNFQSD